LLQQQQQQTALLLSVKNLVDLYEEILPIIVEKTTTKTNISNSLSVDYHIRKLLIHLTI